MVEKPQLSEQWTPNTHSVLSPLIALPKPAKPEPVSLGYFTLGFGFVQSLITPSVAVSARSLPIQGSNNNCWRGEVRGLLNMFFFPAFQSQVEWIPWFYILEKNWEKSSQDLSCQSCPKCWWEGRKNTTWKNPEVVYLASCFKKHTFNIVECNNKNDYTEKEQQSSFILLSKQCLHKKELI